jgi:DNA-binding transcriptional ArsR family regulator
MLRALEFTLARGGFDDPRQKKAAAGLVKDLRGNKSRGGRQQVLTSILKKGATVGEMVRATGSSRRTIFRYLNSFEEAGLEIQLENGVYRFK